MAIKDEELEEKDLELDGVESEEDSEDQKDQEKESSDLDDSEEDSEDSQEDSSTRQVSDEDREAIRERRRREKKLKRERDRQERLRMQNTIFALEKQVEELKKGQGSIQERFQQTEAQKIESEMSELQNIYKQSQKAMEKAVADGDGTAFAEAKSISDRAWAKFNKLDVLKTSFSKQEKQEPKEEFKETEQKVKLGPKAQSYGINFIKQNSEWYDPNGGNLDSKIMMAIDAELYNEGYDPETKDYWDELRDRGAERLPHRFKKQSSAQAKPKSVVGGSGRDSSSSVTPEKNLPKEFVQTLKIAGYWDDPAKRKAAIKNYYANRKGA